MQRPSNCGSYQEDIRQQKKYFHVNVPDGCWAAEGRTGAPHGSVCPGGAGNPGTTTFEDFESEDFETGVQGSLVEVTAKGFGSFGRGFHGSENCWSATDVGLGPFDAEAETGGGRRGGESKSENRGFGAWKTKQGKDKK